MFAAAAMLLVGGPILLFPEIVSPAIRYWTVVSIALGAFVLGGRLARPWRPFDILVWLLALVAAVTWFRMPAPDAVSLRHFAGLALGMLAMSAVAVWCRNELRLATSVAVVSLAAIGTLAVGIAGAYVGHPKLLPLSFSSSVVLALPGLSPENNYLVNPDALGGTALLVLPITAALAALSARGPRAWLERACGAAAAVFAVLVIVISQSRSAWVAGALTVLAWALFRIRHRAVRATLLTIPVTLAGLALWALLWWHPGDFGVVHEFTWAGAEASVAERIAIWRDAIGHLSRSPVFGLGINTYHVATLGPPFNRVDAVAHAHNILLQVALDFGLVGLILYVAIQATLLVWAARAARGPNIPAGRIALGAGLSLVGVHLFGMGDAIALGAKVGLFQWLAAGLILAAWRIVTRSQITRSTQDRFDNDVREARLSL
jgi:putative inorganic carbon (HCO3(-)) transporter